MYYIVYNGIEYTGKTINGLAHKIKKHNFVNENLDLIGYVKSNAKKVNKNIRLKNSEHKSAPIKFSDGVNGAYALIKNIEGSIVPQEEINRRSIICSSCRVENETGRSIKGVIESTDCRMCGFGKSFSNFINKLKKSFGSGFNIPNGLSDKHCVVCSCALSIMLPSKMDRFNESQEKQDKRPDHCWIKKSSNNYKE